MNWTFHSRWLHKNPNEILASKVSIYIGPEWTFGTCTMVSPPTKIIETQSEHYIDVIMTVMASQISSVSNVCSAVCSGADQRKHIKAPRHWPLWWESTGDRWFPSQRASNAENVSIWRRHLKVLTLKGPIPYIYGTQVWLSLCLQMS